MDELERAIRSAKPFAANRHTPLSERAERDLQALERARSDAIERRADRRPLYVSVLSAAAALVAIFIALAFSAPRPAVAITPPPLPVTMLSEEAKGLLLEMSLKAAESGPGDDGAIRMQSWTLSTTSDGRALDSVVTPQVTEITNLADGSRKVRVTAGVSYGASTDKDAVEPGTLIWEEDYPAGSYGYIFKTAPPSDSEKIGSYFQVALHDSESMTTGAYFLGLANLLIERTLEPQEEAAILGFLATRDNIEVVGTTTDRLGRVGVLFQASDRDPGNYKDLLVVSHSTGQILSIETVYVGTQRDDIPSPAVIAYYAWERY